MYCSGWQTLQAVNSLSAISTTQLCPSRVKATIENIYRSMHAVMFIKKKNLFYRSNWLATDLIQVKLLTKLYDIYQTLIWNFQYFKNNKLNLLLLS